jgi:hypothetical protein
LPFWTYAATWAHLQVPYLYCICVLDRFTPVDKVPSARSRPQVDSSASFRPSARGSLAAPVQAQQRGIRRVRCELQRTRVGSGVGASRAQGGRQVGTGRRCEHGLARRGLRCPAAAGSGRSCSAHLQTRSSNHLCCGWQILMFFVRSCSS